MAKSAKRTPRGESSRQRPGKSSMGGILPTQRPYIQPTPVVTLTFFSSDQVAIYNKKWSKSARRNLGDGTCRTDGINRREAETRGINRAQMVFDCSQRSHLRHVSRKNHATTRRWLGFYMDSTHLPLPLPYYTPLSMPGKNRGRVLDSQLAGDALVNSPGTHQVWEVLKTAMGRVQRYTGSQG